MSTLEKTVSTPDDAANQTPREFGAGSKVGDYVVSGKIGEGGMATVYAATHPLLGKKVAVKVISRALSTQAEGVERFLQEARCATQIQHPNIVDVFNWGALPDGRCYFIMEWLPGQVLSEFIDDSGMSLVEKLDVLAQICDALEAAHAKGVVHRDLKPDNIVLVPLSGRQKLVKLLDFGLAKLMNQDGSQRRLTRIGLTMGTPEYISPEQARGKDVDPRTDIYALGVVAYELMVGKLPFIADSAAETLAMHLNEIPPAPSWAWPEIPALLEDLILNMLAKNPSDRPDLVSIRNHFTGLRRKLLTQGDVTLSAPNRARVASLHPTPISALNGEIAMPTTTRRLTRAAAFALVAVAGAAAALVLRPTHGEPEARASVEAADAPLPVARTQPRPVAIDMQTPVAALAPAPAPAPVTPGALLVAVNVPGDIWLDGKLMASGKRGRAAFEQAGEHDLAVTARGYQPFHSHFSIDIGASLEVPVTLLAKKVTSARAVRGAGGGHGQLFLVDPWQSK